MTNPLIIADATVMPGGSRPESEVSLGTFIALVWRWRWLNLCIVLLATGFGVSKYLLATPTYSAQTKIHLQQSGPPLLHGEREQLAIVNDSDFAAAQVQIVTSTPVLQIAADIVRNFDSFKGERNIVQHLRSRVLARHDRRTQLITIAYRGANPVDTAKTADAMVQAYITFERNERRAAVAQLVAALRADRSHRTDELAERTRELLVLQNKHGALSLGNEHVTVVTEHLSRLSDALLEARLDASKANVAYADTIESLGVDAELLQRAEQLSGVESFSGVSSEDASAARARLISALQTQLRMARPARGSNNPHLQTLESQLDQLVLIHIASIKQDAIRADAKVQQILRGLEQQQALAHSLTAVAAEFTRSKGEIERLRRMIDSMSDRINGLEIAAATPSEMVVVIEPARPPSKPSSPDAISDIGVWTLIGLAASLGLSLVVELLRPRVRSVMHVRSLIDAPILAGIPHLEGSDAFERYQASRSEPSGACAEAFRMLRTTLLNRGRDDLRVIAITSAQAGDGKSTVACNLAIVLAQTGRRVVLVDADFRRSLRLVNTTDVNAAGLSEVIAGAVALGETIVVGEDRAPDYLPPGSTPSTGAELLGSARFGEILAELKARYDHIIVDTPAAGHTADARIIAKQCDTTLLVIRAEQSNRRLCEAAYRSLRVVGADVSGVIINDIRRDTLGGYSDYVPEYHARGVGPERAGPKLPAVQSES